MTTMHKLVFAIVIKSLVSDGHCQQLPCDFLLGIHLDHKQIQAWSD